MQVAESVGEGEGGVCDAEGAGDVAGPGLVEGFVLAWVLVLAEDIGTENADCILILDSLSLHMFESFLLFFIQNGRFDFEEVVDESAEKGHLESEPVLLLRVGCACEFLPERVKLIDAEFTVIDG